MRPTNVRLFIKPYCGWCHEAMEWLDARQISYEQGEPSVKFGDFMKIKSLPALIL